MKKLIYCAMALLTMMVMNISKCMADDGKGAGKKPLVIYYSQGGTTAQVANELQRALSADIVSLQLENPYASNYDETLERCREERAKGIIPKVLPLKVDLSQYDRIFLGYPIWFGTCALPMIGLLQEEQFDGKEIVPFCTFGSGGLESSIADLKRALPNAKIANGYGVRTARIKAMPAELNRFLIEGGYLPGTIEPLPAYSEAKPVSSEETAIFNAACSSYKFPLGTPKTVAKRTTPTSTDYRFTAEATMPTGEAATFTVYVTVGNEPGAVAEFTRVVR
jgi:flavodoxin